MMHRRARPLLGTMVELRAEAATPTDFDRAADAAFEAVAEVHRLMSFHESASDVRRIARAQPGQRLRVHSRTAAVLRQSMRWSRASRGAFDPACGRRAVASGWLPAPEEDRAGVDVPLEEALTLAGRELRVHAPTWLDLGGIAKGYAIDRAVAMLRRRGVVAGSVNAGGDLRVFGSREETIHVRSPFDPAQFFQLAALRDSACATSASGSVFAPCTPAGKGCVPTPCSVTVIAPTACAADALTKIVWLRGRDAADLLRRARAHAFVVQADGAAWRL